MEKYSITTFLKPNNDIYIADSSAVRVLTNFWPTVPVSKFSGFNKNEITERIKCFFEKEYIIIDNAGTMCAYKYLTPIITREERKNYLVISCSCYTNKKSNKCIRIQT